ncbi:MAG: putative zinc-binding protein, partial [Planctomycetota bacterium]
MSSTQFVIAPCMGVGKIVANVTRRAAYLVQQRNPETTAILSLPALLAGDPEQRELVKNRPVILVDGCTERCGMHIFNQLGVYPVAKIEVGQIMSETKMGPGKTRQQLEDIGKRLAESTAARIELVMKNEELLKSFQAAQELRWAVPCPECSRACSCLPGELQTAEPAATPRKYVTIFPCQGIRRTGGRVAQRAGYILIEEKFPGKTLLLCVPALSAAVPEDVEMLEQFPTVALNGCGLRCATVNAARHGVPAAASIDLDTVDPGFKGERECA